MFQCQNELREGETHKSTTRQHLKFVTMHTLIDLFLPPSRLLLRWLQLLFAFGIWKICTCSLSYLLVCKSIQMALIRSAICGYRKPPQVEIKVADLKISCHSHAECRFSKDVKCSNSLYYTQLVMQIAENNLSEITLASIPAAVGAVPTQC